MSIEIRSSDADADKAAMAPKDAVSEQKPAESLPEQSEGETQSAAENTAASGAVESEEDDKTESETESETEKEEEGGEEQAKAKKKGGFKKRIEKLNARISEREREVEYWRAEALKRAQASNVDPKVDSTKPPQSSAEGKPKADDFETHAEFVEALTDWKTDQKLKEHDEKENRRKLETEQQTVHRTYSERLSAFKDAHEDFDDVLENLNAVPRSLAVEQVIVSSESGPEILYELAKNPDEARRIAALSPLLAARELGRLEARLIKPSSESKESKETKITKAPKPIAPVGSGGKGSVTKSITDPNLSQAEYEKLRREQQLKRRQA